MIKGIGTDLVEIKRIKSLALNRLLERIFSQNEMNQYLLINDEARKLTFIAGRYAAKEALFKAFKKGDMTANYKDFEILNDTSGAPYVVSKYLTNLNHHLSITHTNDYAIAFVVLELIE